MLYIPIEAIIEDSACKFLIPLSALPSRPVTVTPSSMAFILSWDHGDGWAEHFTMRKGVLFRQISISKICKKHSWIISIWLLMVWYGVFVCCLSVLICSNYVRIKAICMPSGWWYTYPSENMSSSIGMTKISHISGKIIQSCSRKTTSHLSSQFIKWPLYISPVFNSQVTVWPMPWSTPTDGEAVAVPRNPLGQEPIVQCPSNWDNMG